MRIKRIIVSLLSLAVIFSLFCSVTKAENAEASVRIYVSENGNDKNSGTENAPFATLKRARDYLQNLDKNNLSEGAIEIIIKEGEYVINEPVCFDSSCTGTEKNPIIIKGEDGKEVRITTGINIDAEQFKLVEDEKILSRLPEEARGNVYFINLKKLGITEYGEEAMKKYSKQVEKHFELYFNHTPITVSRYPNDSFMRTGTIVEANSEKTVFMQENERYKRWEKADQAIVYGFWKNGWGDDAMKVEDIDAVTGKISAQGSPTFGIGSDTRYYIYNLLEEIDVPGEYFLDRNKGILYLYPPSDIESSKIEISTFTDYFINAEYVDYLTIENLTLEGSCGNGIYMKYCDNCNIRFCKIKNIAGLAILMTGGKDSTIYGCELYNLGGKGIATYCGDRNTLTPGNVTIQNCHIHKFAQYSKTYTPAIDLYFVGNKVLNNVIHDAPHMAVSLRGNDNIYMYNEIYDVVQDSDDAGAMYGGRDWASYGNVISNNYIHDIYGTGSQVIGVYLDDTMPGTVIKDNVFNNINQAIGVGGGCNNTVTNNLMMNKTDNSRRVMYYDARGYDAWFRGSYDEDPENNTLTKSLNAVPYTSEVWRKAYPQMLPVIEKDPMMPQNGVVKNNIISNHTLLSIADAVIENGDVSDNYITEKTVEIVRDERGKYSFNDKDGLFADCPGYEEPDISKIGLLDDYPFELPEKYNPESRKTVEIKTVQAPEIDVTPILDATKWDPSAAKVVQGDGEIIMGQGASGYTEEPIDDVKMKFKMSMSEGAIWTGFMLRSLATDQVPWATTNYLIVVKKDAFELQRWRGSQIIIRTLENTFYAGDDNYANVEIEISNLENDVGTQIIFRYNGVKVFDYIDTNEDAIIKPGYFSLYLSGNENAEVHLGQYDPALQTSVTYNPYGEGVESDVSQNYRLKLDNGFINLSESPIKKGDVIYVGAEDYLKALGARIYFNKNSNTIIAYWNNRDKFVAKIGESNVTFNNNVVPIEKQLIFENNKILLPILDVSNIIGYEAKVEDALGIINLKKQN